MPIGPRELVKIETYYPGGYVHNEDDPLGWGEVQKHLEKSPEHGVLWQTRVALPKNASQGMDLKDLLDQSTLQDTNLTYLTGISLRSLKIFARALDELVRGEGGTQQQQAAYEHIQDTFGSVLGHLDPRLLTTVVVWEFESVIDFYL